MEIIYLRKISCFKIVFKKGPKISGESSNLDPIVGFLTIVLPLFDLVMWWVKNIHWCPQAIIAGMDNVPRQMMVQR